ncbi:MAG: c-type cytochrome [Candidatus Aquirickettsiella gammari]
MKTTLLFAATLTLLASGSAMANADLAKSKNCMACHSVDKKIVGPGFKDVAKKYAGDNTAEAKLVTKILKGGSGAWGAIPMPANAQVSEAEAKTLTQWIMSLK